MNPLDKLLEPISADHPCGEDLFRDGSLMQLEALIKTQLNAEEVEIEPDWRRVRQEALALADRSKDLRVGVILCLALLRLEGLAGFRDGLSVLHGWADKFWESLFPLLDPEDPEDPTRVFVFNNLTAPLATETPYKFINYLRQVPLCQPARLSPCCLRDVLQAEEKRGSKESGEKPAATAEQIAAAFHDTPADKLQKISEVLAAVCQAVESLESLVTTKSTGAQGPNFTALKQTLEAMRATLAQYVAPAEAASGASATSEKSGAMGAAVPNQQAFALKGAIQSRAEAEAALRAVGDYFKRCEPSSPVPLFLERCVRLLHMDFLEGLGELALGSQDEFKKLFGVPPGQSDSEPSPSEGKTA